MKNLLFKFIIFTFIFILFVTYSSQVLANSITVQATTEDISEYYLKLNWKDSGTWVFPTARFMYYIKDNKKYPAYCIDESLPGAEAGSYSVTANEVIKDARIWRVLTKGYGYKTPQEMGLDNKYQAYLATRFAIFCILYDYEVDERYMANDATGEKIIQAMKEMVNYGRTGTSTYTSPTASIKENGEAFVETINDVQYISQKYTVSSSVPLISYSIKTEKLPSGSKIFNSSNIETSNFTDKSFKISIPLTNIPKNISGKIVLENIKLKSYPVLVGVAPSSDLQNYALVTESYEVTTTDTVLNLEISGDIKICKLSEDYNHILDLPANSPLAGAEFKIEKQDGTLIGNFVTDENGIILVEDLPLGTYIVTEIKSPEHFISNTVPQPVTISTKDECAELIFKNDSEEPPPPEEPEIPEEPEEPEIPEEPETPEPAPEPEISVVPEEPKVIEEPKEPEIPKEIVQVSEPPKLPKTGC